MEYTRLMSLTLLLVLLGVGLTTSQMTGSRNCDCQYITEDGRCAYTILLPTGGGSKGSPQCPKKDMEGDKEKAEQLMGHLEQLKANITELRLVSGDQARMLSQLQSLLLRQQEALRPLTELLSSKGQGDSDEESGEESGDSSEKSGSGSTPSPGSGMGMGGGSGRGNPSSSCQLCPEVEQTLAGQRQAVESLQQQIIQIYTSVTTLSQTLGNLDQLIPMDQITQAIEQQQNQSQALQRYIQELTVNVTKAQQEAQMMLKMNPFNCVQRGLLVSGPVMNITDEMITASSTYNGGHAAVRGRINAQATGETLKGAWCASENRTKAEQAEPNAPEEWLQFDLGKVKSIFGVVTKGRSDYGQWVTSYSLNYTTTDPTVVGTVWTSYTNVLGEGVTFMGNMDQNTAQVNMLWQPILARYIRVIPLSSDTNKCMRADVIGCLDEQ